MEREGIACRKALIKFVRRCREIAWQALLLHPIPRLGGPGVVVQIDESKFNYKSKVGLAHKILQYILQYVQQIWAGFIYLFYFFIITFLNSIIEAAELEEKGGCLVSSTRSMNLPDLIYSLLGEEMQ